MENPDIKKVVRLSWLREQAAQEFEVLKRVPNLDSSFFSAEELEHYIGVLIRSNEEDWLVIDDTDD